MEHKLTEPRDCQLFQLLGKTISALSSPLEILVDRQYVLSGVLSVTRIILTESLGGERSCSPST